MPLIIDGGRVPSRWAQRQTAYGKASTGKGAGQDGAIHVAFINNMPDAALEDTEVQFFELLDAGSSDVPVYVKLFSLRGVPRGQRGIEHLGRFYSDFDELWRNKFDAAIITGTEPHEPNLRKEPYWNLLIEVFDWAGRETTSTILSCLAAHACVLHNDGVGRHRLPDKQFGVFESQKMYNDRLTAGVASLLRFPHSRWNEIRENELTSAGYSVLTKSKEAGVDVFTKKIRRSLFLHFQGHPEYNADTLFKEYRRDIKRFLRSERDTYPTLPNGYFDLNATEKLTTFREQAVANKSEEIMESFPEAVEVELQNTWRSSAVSIYRAWLQSLFSERTAASLVPAIKSLYGNVQPKGASAS